MSEAKDLTEIRKQIQQRSAEQKLTRRSTMSVPEMRKLLGLKKTDSYWLVHKNFFKTEVIGGMMRIDLVSFEKWYANQVKYKKVDGEEPGKELREKSYSFKEAANILGIHDCDLYDIWKNEKLEYITVDFVRRIPVDIFEKWYVCRMRRICLGFHGKNWQKSQGAKKLEDFWIPPSAIIKGGSQERVFSYSLMLRMYITSWMMGMNRKKIQYPWR